jgi:signal-transduction protein with cAMP-binding, CBS, and nucleotidyltransferase domain
MSRIADNMRRVIKKVAHTTPITEAAGKMSAERVGSLFIEKKGELVGIVTESDVVKKAVATGSELGNLTVEKIMTYPIKTIESDRSMQDAHDMMADLGVRHLAVTEGGKIVGLISVRDLLVYFKRVSEPKITQD